MSSSCQIERLYNEEASFLTMKEVHRLKTRESTYCDDALVYFAQSALTTSIDIAVTKEKGDKVLRKEQDRFNKALEAFQATIASITDPGFRCSVSLPAEYTESLHSNYFINYNVSNVIGAPIKERETAFYLRLLALYQAFTGKKPKYSVGGPTTRFMREIVQVLEIHLSKAVSETEIYSDVQRLWRLPGDEAIAAWIKKQGIRDILQKKVDHCVNDLVNAYERETGRRAIM